MRIRTIEDNFDYQMHEVFKEMKESYEDEMRGTDEKKTFSNWIWDNVEDFGKAVYERFDMYAGIDVETEKYIYPMKNKELYLKLGTAPDPSTIKKNPHGGFDYIPISNIESNLDEIFGVMGWKTSNPAFHILANESWTEEIQKQQGKKTVLKSRIFLACSLSLFVKDENGEWIERIGYASGKFSETQSDTCAAKLSAEAFKNAAKGLGVRFGRDLNRKDTRTGLTLRKGKKEVYAEIVNELSFFETEQEIKNYAGKSPYSGESWFEKEVEKALKKENLITVMD